MIADIHKRAKTLHRKARDRAVVAEIPFDLTVAHVRSLLESTNGIDPVFGVPFVEGDQRMTPSLDRVVPQLGYTIGNVIVVSRFANVVKNEATIEEIRMVLRYYEGLQREDVG